MATLTSLYTWISQQIHQATFRIGEKVYSSLTAAKTEWTLPRFQTLSLFAPGNFHGERTFSLSPSFASESSQKNAVERLRFFSRWRRGLPAIIEISSCSRTSRGFLPTKSICFCRPRHAGDHRVRCQLEDSLSLSLFFFIFARRLGTGRWKFGSRTERRGHKMDEEGEKN